MGAFGGKDISSPFVYFDQTLRTRASTTTGRRNKNARIGQRSEQFAPSRNIDRLLVIDQDFDVPAGDQTRFGRQDQTDQRQDDQREHQYPENNLDHLRYIPPKDMNAKAIRPTVMNVMPNPLSPSGTSLYFIFSRIPASAAIARAQPTPDPNPNTQLSEKL